MPVLTTYPGVYIEELPSGVRTISGVATSIGLFIGWAARGATDRAVRLASFSDYEREYGGLDTRTLLGYAVKQFFENGGGDTYVIRLAAGDAVPASVTINANLTVAASSSGEWANIYQIRTTRRADDASRFRLDVLDTTSNGAVVESFENLSMDDADPRFPANVINGRSRLITVTATDAAAAPTNATVDLDGTTAGVDGTVLVPDSAAFNTAALACFGVGSITDRLDLFNLVVVPGETDTTTLAALQGHAAARRAFLIADSPEGETVANMVLNGLTNLTGSFATNAALYYPWVEQADPLQAGARRAFPPSGFVAGIYARTDGARGVWKAPAGTEAAINGSLGLETVVSDAENGQLNPLGINCLRTFPIYGNVVWGARTLHGQDERGSDWKYVPVRRLTLMLEESLYRGTQWVVFEPNDEPLWAQIRLNVGAFMNSLFRQGAFQGKTPREAYLVKCDRETTTQDDINRGIVNILVMFAPLKPAEFVVIKIQQMAGQLQT